MRTMYVYRIFHAANTTTFRLRRISSSLNGFSLSSSNQHRRNQKEDKTEGNKYENREGRGKAGRKENKLNEE